ncbi:MAG: TIGR02466 family protein [Bdellovibrio sp.]
MIHAKKLPRKSKAKTPLQFSFPPKNNAHGVILELFPTLIIKQTLLGPRSPLLRELIESSLILKDRDFPGIRWCQKNYPFGYTSFASQNRLHQLSSSFEKLKSLLDHQIDTVWKAFGYQGSSQSLVMTDLWVNVMGPGCSHSGHTHPRSVLSGSIYLQMPTKASAIKFEDPRLPNLMNSPLNALFPSHVSVPTRGGELIFFPR